MERVKGKSGRQGSPTGKAGAGASLTAVLRVSASIVHPDPNPLLHFIKLTSRVRCLISLHVKNPLSGTLRGAGEGKIRPSRIFARCAAPAASLTAVFRVSASIVHPHPNPLQVRGSLRLGFDASFRSTKNAPDGGIYVERVKGIEPSTQAWEARILPLNYTRRVDSYNELIIN